MDSRLPPHPHYPDGKTFTHEYFLKTPDKPNLGKDKLLIYQSKINPPHFKVTRARYCFKHNVRFCAFNVRRIRLLHQ